MQRGDGFLSSEKRIYASPEHCQVLRAAFAAYPRFAPVFHDPPSGLDRTCAGKGFRLLPKGTAVRERRWFRWQRC